ncbi:glycoprotein hormone beta-5 [Culicoides brevitarsis]|uniref:glycoprotein hormone beta-5 n=1 Tax=Culicoides brevitarsis TaxID=469753 RepID=UPI00307C9130
MNIFCFIPLLFCHAVFGQANLFEIQPQILPTPNLGCELFEYEHAVEQVDSQGRKCWGKVLVNSCIGRCDSKEISDWKFPHKKAFHPVCLHAEKVLRTHNLPNCEENAEPGTNIYEYVEAKSCKCQICSPEKANCIGQAPASKPGVPTFPFFMNGRRFESASQPTYSWSF